MVVFELLLRRPPALDGGQLAERLRQFDPAFREAVVVTGTGRPTEPFVVQLGEHTVALTLFSMPHPDAKAVEAALQASHYDQSRKTAARNHRAYIRGELSTDKPVSLDGMVVLAGVMGALSSADALVVVHLAARASLPAQALMPEPVEGERLPTLRAFPLGLFYVGFVKYQIEGEEGVWMATHNAALVGLPEFTMHVPDHSWGQTVLDIFDRLHRYLLQSGACFSPGDTATLGPEFTVRFEAPDEPLEFMSPGRSWLVVTTQ